MAECRIRGAQGYELKVMTSKKLYAQGCGRFRNFRAFLSTGIRASVLFPVVLAAVLATARCHAQDKDVNGAPITLAKAITVTIQDEAPYFVPKRSSIAQGTTVTWKNVGPALIHTILIRSANGNVTSGSITPGHSWSYAFKEGEDAVVRSSCEIHPYMYGILIVGNPSSELVRAVESESHVINAGTAVRYREFPLPVPDSVPGILAMDEEDSTWFTMGGGGFGNLSMPPLSNIGRMTAEGDLAVYTLPTAAAGPSGIVLGEHGVAYVTEFFGNKIARIDANTKAITEFPIPTPNAWPTGIAKDSAGNIWFSETNGNKVAKLTPRGNIVEYPLPTPEARSTGLAIDKEGNVWISERDANKIACLRRDGSFVEYAVPTPNAKPTGIAVDAENAVWFAEREGDKIGRITAGKITEFPLPQAHSGPFIVMPDREGSVWFSEIFGNRIGHLDPRSERVEEFKIPSGDSWPAGIAGDSVGNIWYASPLKNRVGVLVMNQPASVTAGTAGVRSEHEGRSGGPAGPPANQ
jgi:streptogramin lyase/plastocyanin